MEHCWHGNTLFSMQQEVIFEGLGMLENWQNLAHTSEGLNIEIRYGLQDFVWQNGSIVVPTKFQWSSSRCTFHLDVCCLLGTCNIPRLKKSLLVPCPKSNRKSAIFKFNFKFQCIFGHLQESYFNKLLLENLLDQDQIWSVQSKVLCDEKFVICELLLNGIAVARRPFCAFRHDSSSCCNSRIHWRVCPKRHMFDKSPGLKTSICQYS